MILLADAFLVHMCLLEGVFTRRQSNSAQHFLLVSTWPFASSCSSLIFFLSVYCYLLMSGLPVFFLLAQKHVALLH